MSEEYTMHYPGGSIDLTIDPCDNYEVYDTEELVAACGLLPGFVAVAAEGESPEQVYDMMNAVYGMNLTSDYNMLGASERSGSMEGDVYKYEGDPDMYPYVKFVLDNAEVLIYPYGMVLVRGGEFAHMTRMD